MTFILSWLLTHILEVVFGLVIAGFGYAIKKMNKKIDEQQAIKLGVQALLRDRIIQAYNVYYDKGYCPIYARENITAMAKEYFNLGGNGVVINLIEKLNDLPTDYHFVPDGEQDKKMGGC